MAEDKIDILIDRKAFADDVSFAAKTCQQIVELVKQAKASIVDVSQAATPSEFISAVQKTEQVTKAAAAAHKELTTILQRERQELDSAKSTLNKVASSLEENIRVQLQYKSALKDVQDELKKLQKEASMSASKADDYKTRIVELAQEEKRLKVAIAESEQSIKAQTKEINAAEGSYDQMNQVLGQLRDAYRKLGEEERNSSTGDAMLQNIAYLDSRVKEIDESIGNFHRNVGNYAGALKPSFDNLQSELSNIKQELSGMKETDAGFDELNKQATLFEQLITSLNKEFKTTKQEQIAFTDAAKKLGKEFGIASQEFQTFIQSVSSNKDELGDIQAAIDFHASDTKYLDGTISAIQGVVGAYGAWQAATVLLGNDNEELQKSMEKLQAIMTLVQSLQAVLNAVQTESGAIQTALAAKVALVNAAKKAEALIFGQSTAAVTANTATTVTNTTAQRGLAAGTGAATAATISLRTALIATGIGALIIGIVMGITKLISVISDWNNADEKALESQKGLAEALNDVAEAQIRLSEQTRKAVNERLEAMEHEATLLKARGVSQERALAIDKQVAEARLKVAESEAFRNNVTEESRAKADKALQKSLSEEEVYLGIIAAIKRDAAEIGEEADEDEIERLQKKLDAVKTNTAGYKTEYDKQTNILKDVTDAQNDVNRNAVDAAKLAADERRKLVLESTRIESELVMVKNNTILNSDKSTYTQRIEALRSNLEEQKKVALAEKKDIINNTSSSEADKKLATKKYNASITKLNEQQKKDELKIVEEYNKKIAEAEYMLLKQKSEANKETLNKIIDNEYEVSEKRLTAVSKYIQTSQQQEIDDYNYKKKILEQTIPDKELRDKAIQLLDAEHYAKVVQITEDGEKKKRDVIQSSIEQQQFINDKFKEFILQTNQTDVDLTQQYSEDIQALNQSLQDKKISYEQYEEELLKLQNQYGKDSIEVELEKQKKLLNSGILTDKEKKEALIKIAKLEKDLSDATTKEVIDNEKKKSEALLKTLALAKQVTDEILNTIQAVIAGNLERQKNATQEEIDDINRKKEEDIAAAEASALTQQEKADKIATINAVAQAKQEALQRKQKELDQKKAQADRAFQIFKIIGNTAMAVTSALASFPPNVPLAIAAGIIGAAQLAAVLATPIPKYKYGSDDTGEAHLGMVGDGGKQEVIQTPSGDTYLTPNKPTLSWIPAHSKIYPNAKDFMVNVARASLYSTLKGAGNTVDTADFDRAYIKTLENKLDSTNEELRSVKSAIQGLPIQVWSINDSGVTKVTKKGNQFLKHIDNYFRY